MEKHYTVYRHVCPNGKCYIGITGQALEIRWNNGHGYDSQLFGRAINKYGWENITHEILFDSLSLEEAYEKEIEMIEYYKSFDSRYGYNASKGGAGASGHSVSEETRKKMSKNANMMWEDPQIREKLVAHLREISERNRGRKMPRDAVEKTLQASRKRVDQYSLDGKYITTHKSMMDAARVCGKECNSAIVACCRGRRNEAYGYIWRYAGEPLDYDRYLKSQQEKERKRALHCLDALEHRIKPVKQLTLEGNLVSAYASVAEAKRKTGINTSGIFRCCNGDTDTFKGYKWQYANS